MNMCSWTKSFLIIYVIIGHFLSIKNLVLPWTRYTYVVYMLMRLGKDGELFAVCVICHKKTSFKLKC